MDVILEDRGLVNGRKVANRFPSGRLLLLGYAPRAGESLPSCENIQQRSLAASSVTPVSKHQSPSHHLTHSHCGRAYLTKVQASAEQPSSSRKKALRAMCR